MQSTFNLAVPIFMGTVMFTTVNIVATNLLVDVLNRWVDPRIKAAA